MNYTAADPFDIFEQAEPFGTDVAEEETSATSRLERIWLIIFDVLVALALLFLLSGAIPAEASSPDVEHSVPAGQMTALAVTLSPVGYADSVYGLSYDGPIMYTILVTNKGLIAARNVTVSISLVNDPFLMQTPWDCDFDGCTMLIEELEPGESQEIGLTHGMIVPAIVVEREEDAYIAITPPEVSVAASNSLPATAPSLDDDLVCRCLAVYNPSPSINANPSINAVPMVYMPTVYVPSSLGFTNAGHTEVGRTEVGRTEVGRTEVATN